MLLIHSDKTTLTLKGHPHNSFWEMEVIPNILIKKRFNTWDFKHIT